MDSCYISIPEDVFSRSEQDGLQFVMRPLKNAPPHVVLLAPPASDVWRQLIRQGGEGSLIDFSARNLSLFTQLNGEGLLHIRGDLLPEGRIMATRQSLGLRDPWNYQFKTPVLHTPWFALWEITDDCPLKSACHYCYRPKEISGGPTPIQAERICQQIEQSKIPWVTLLGGEPIIYPHLYQVIERLRSMRVFVKLISNGVLINRKNALALRDSDINQVAISLDGLDAENHDLNRGRGTFEKSLRAIRLLKEYVPLVSISLTVTNLVFDQLEQLPAFCADLGVPEVYLSPLRLAKNTRLPSPDVGPMRPDQSSRLGQVTAALNSNELKVISLRECSCGRSSVVIHSDGKISPCPFATCEYGNIYDENFSDIWARVMPVSLRIGSLETGSYCFRRHEQEALASIASAVSSPSI